MGVSWLLAKDFLERELKNLENVSAPDQIKIERVRIQLGQVKWAFQKVHEQLGRYANKQVLTRSRAPQR